MSSSFLQAYMKEIAFFLPQNHADNYDEDRFGPEPNVKASSRLKAILREILWRRGLVSSQAMQKSLLNAVHFVEPHLVGLQNSYSLLEDDESRELLAKLVAYRALGYRKVKLPLNSTGYWSRLANIKGQADKDDYIQTSFQNWKLYRTDMVIGDTLISAYLTPRNVLAQFVLRQYECDLGEEIVRVTSGDTVIDGGGCWGDSALYFAHGTGGKGRVLSVEFVPSNLDVLERNLSMNPRLAKRIEIVRNALWNESGLTLSYDEKGPGSAVKSFGEVSPRTQTMTITIDDLVVQHQLTQVDFVKLDIEGAELAALQGAASTIQRFRPKLAIALYHRFSDFVEIPAYLDSLGLGYKFYLRHFTIHAEESILFARSL